MSQMQLGAILMTQISSLREVTIFMATAAAGITGADSAILVSLRHTVAFVLHRDLVTTLCAYVRCATSCAAAQRITVLAMC